MQSLSNEPCMARSTPFDVNPIELNYYLITVVLDKCNESSNADDDLL